MPQTVPLQPLANQTLQAQLANQAVTLNVYQQAFGLYMDVMIGTQAIVQGIIARNSTLIIRNTYFGFSGDFIFLDTQGNSDPIFTGLGSRFVLIYLTAAEIAAYGFPTGVE